MFSLEGNITPDDKKRKRKTIIALDFLAKCLLKLKPALRARGAYQLTKKKTNPKHINHVKVNSYI